MDATRKKLSSSNDALLAVCAGTFSVFIRCASYLAAASAQLSSAIAQVESANERLGIELTAGRQAGRVAQALRQELVRCQLELVEVTARSASAATHTEDVEVERDGLVEEVGRLEAKIASLQQEARELRGLRN